MKVLMLLFAPILCFSQNLSPFGNNQHSSGTSGVHTAIEYQGELYFTGSFSKLNGTFAKGVARYNGSSISAVDSALGFGYATTIHNNELIIANYSPLYDDIVSWDGTKIEPIGMPGYCIILDLISHQNKIFATGQFTVNNKTYLLAEYDDSTWNFYGQAPQNGTLGRRMLIYQNELIVSGQFNFVDSTIFYGVASFDGNKLSPYGGTFPDSGIVNMNSVAIQNDTLWVAGEQTADMSSCLYFFDGSSWNSTRPNDFKNAAIARVFNTDQKTFFVAVDSATQNGNFYGAQAYLRKNGDFIPIGDSVYNNDAVLSNHEEIVCGIVPYNNMWILYGTFDMIDKNGPTVATLAVINNVLGIESEPTYSRFSLFPNPTTKYIQINQDYQDGFYSIYNLTGQVVKSGKANRIILIDNLTAGQYIFELQMESEVLRKRFVKIH